MRLDAKPARNSPNVKIHEGTAQAGRIEQCSRPLNVDQHIPARRVPLCSGQHSSNVPLSADPRCVLRHIVTRGEEMSCKISMESFTEVVYTFTESPCEDPSVSGRPDIPLIDRDGQRGGTSSIDLPVSLVSRLGEASRRTGLSFESLVWDAVDFYLQQKIYEWVAITRAGAPGCGEGLEPVADASRNSTK